LWAFADNPEQFLGVFSLPEFDDALCAIDRAPTFQWEIIRTRSLSSARRTVYKWYELERLSDAPRLEHTLHVMSDAAGRVSKFVLTCKVSTGRTHKIVYEVHRYRVRAIEFSCPQAPNTEGFPLEDQDLPELNEVLRCIPLEMAQNSSQGLVSA